MGDFSVWARGKLIQSRLANAALLDVIGNRLASLIVKRFIKQIGKRLYIGTRLRSHHIYLSE
jgi:hypothetical protein